VRGGAGDDADHQGTFLSGPSVAWILTLSYFPDSNEFRNSLES